MPSPAVWTGVAVAYELSALNAQRSTLEALLLIQLDLPSFHRLKEDKRLVTTFYCCHLPFNTVFLSTEYLLNKQIQNP
uniref:Secreted protein n=1 Tax=Haemonchus contortus TaxID=6289 RepID=A0A7I4Y4M2_HAECO